MTTNGFTPTQTRILQVLADGEFHTVGEVRGAARTKRLCTFQVHLVHCRNRLRRYDAQAEILYTEESGVSGYRLVRQVNTTLVDLGVDLS